MTQFTDKMKEKINKYVLSEDPAEPSLRRGLVHNLRNIRYFGKIREIVPELKQYKFSTFMHVERRALSIGCKSLSEYHELLLNSSEEREFLKTNFTYMGSLFFRGEEWDYFISKCLASYEGKKCVRVWSAGCSAGQEAYSTVMALLDYVPLERIEVLATDYNDEMIERCGKAEYPNVHLDYIPERYKKYLEIREGRFRVKDELRERVKTGKINLLEDEYPEGFDIILCRNVIKFFSDRNIPQVQKKLADSLVPGGYLFVGNDDVRKRREEVRNPEKYNLKKEPVACIYRKQH